MSEETLIQVIPGIYKKLSNEQSGVKKAHCSKCGAMITIDCLDSFPTEPVCRECMERNIERR